MQYALTHDLAESTTGDVPAPTKWRNSNLDGCLQVLEEQFNRVYHLYQLNDLTEKERNIVKWADMLELVLYCEREVLRGNTFARPILDSGKLWIESRNAPTSEAQELYEDLFRKR
jgi:5'-deoxynucleotidase YfbR-like HD superfamily hydrolase